MTRDDEENSDITKLLVAVFLIGVLMMFAGAWLTPDERLARKPEQIEAEP